MRVSSVLSGPFQGAALLWGYCYCGKPETDVKPPVRCLEIKSIERANAEMVRSGVDPSGARIMAPKQFHYNLKATGLTPAQANVIKQEMLSLGGEAAVAKGAASCSIAESDAILSGTLKQYRLLVEKLKYQSFSLPDVGRAIGEALDNIAKRSFLLKGRTREWTLGKKTLIMGILNVTPDSFSDGGLFFDKEAAIDRALKMTEDGADWIDIGGESTRPGAGPVPVEEELKRIMPVAEALSKMGIAFSVDTSKAGVADEALKAGAEAINDVSALSDPAMAEVCARHKASVILMHMRGTPKDMQKDTAYKDLVGEVFAYLSGRVDHAVDSGIERERIMIDPGLGFGKSKEGNLEMIARLREFTSLGLPILVGPSRKSFIGAITGAKEPERLSGTLAASTAAVINGASALRVHDVKEAREAAAIADAVKMTGLNG